MNMMFLFQYHIENFCLYHKSIFGVGKIQMLGP